jgi:hypothetical protein
MSWTPKSGGPIDLVGADKPTLITHIDTLIADSSSYVFTRRATLVRDYLSLRQSIPVRVMGVSGFDFVLSDQGLDLFMPEKPEKDAELVRYYTFRKTGQRAIGVPFYMSTGTPAISTEAPTGPGQMWVDEAQFFDLFRNSPCRASLWDCLRLEVEGTPLPPPVAAIVSKPAATTARAQRSVAQAQSKASGKEPGKEPSQEPSKEPARVANTVPSRVPGRAPRPVIPVGIDRFRCLAASVRCWQLAGSVYRGIMIELPRVIAVIWAEEIAEKKGCRPDAKSYMKRFGLPDDPGLRDIFRERLETALPRNVRMRFEQYRGKDVRITNEGLFFPMPPEPPTVDDMIIEIRDGRAGNPVFTDSMPPPPE